MSQENALHMSTKDKKCVIPFVTVYNPPPPPEHWCNTTQILGYTEVIFNRQSSLSMRKPCSCLIAVIDIGVLIVNRSIGDHNVQVLIQELIINYELIQTVQHNM